MKNETVVIDFGDNFDNEKIKEVILFRNQGNNYNKIVEKTGLSLDKIKKICRFNKINDQTKYQKPSDDEINSMQKYYEECKSTRKVGKKFNYSKTTVSKYVKIIRSEKLNDETIKKNRSNAVVKWRQDKKVKLVEYKGGCCQVCEYKKSIGALEFHHIDPNQKDFTISSKSYAYERLKREVDKCVLLCSNCHIEVHEEIKNNGYSEIVNKMVMLVVKSVDKIG
jgi:5-methylcytosine-specific restriction endonuclease McrA